MYNITRNAPFITYHLNHSKKNDKIYFAFGTCFGLQKLLEIIQFIAGIYNLNIIDSHFYILLILNKIL